MSLVNYSSSSSDEEELKTPLPQKRKSDINAKEGFPIPIKKHFLPKALNKLGASITEDSQDHVDDVTKHDGRIRSFKHERGNWATHVYIPVDLRNVEDIQEMCRSTLQDVLQLHPQTDLHLSLSKTVVLQHHLIDSFCKSLERSFDGFSRFVVCLQKLKIYANEERTRTFVGVEVDDLYFDKLLELTKAVDDVMQEHNLNKFYKQPSFHTSILWTIGDQVKTLNAHLSQLKNSLRNAFEQTDKEFVVNVDAIHCKTGNKKFVFKLK